ncbi:MAG: FAD-dependent oxidoreductase [Armatimonadetes bacterium]|nr:FAD-dependent oxidoreductase [Armatimonadota bacterium]
MNNGHKANGQPVGSVLVVGAGIGGMQAALDLADAGFKVYLSDKSSAIGGRMAQLDKTFPTNDCAMCTISPKLVEVGRHRNIELVLDSDVMDVAGEAGDFKVTVRARPRFIDIEKCTGCGDCESVCPIPIPDRFNQGLAEQKAIHKLYPQAVPSAYAIAKRGVAPCRDACPAGQRAQGYVALIREGRYEDALRTIKEDNPFPAICGRICNHRCEDACSRNKVDQPVSIRALKRFVTDTIYSGPRGPVEPAERVHPERVAVIGSGPAGLTAAQDLCKMGYGVAVFEALPVAGGMLRVGIPEFRLAAELIEREVQDVLDLGVELRLNTRINDLARVFNEGFQAVLVAVGAHEGQKLRIDGADLEGVLINTSFLREVRLGNPPPLGKRVAVIGAGDVAMDVARTARRLGADVDVYYRRTRDDATGAPEEMRQCEEEGVVFHWQVTPVAITGETGRVTGMTCVRTEPGPLDESGRPRPATVAGSEHFVPCDNVIFSVGQSPDLSFIPNETAVAITRQRTLQVDPATLATGHPGVFAAGDVTTGTTFVIDAIAAGHRAAQSIARYLQYGSVGETTGDRRPETGDTPPVSRPRSDPRTPKLPVAELTAEDIQARMRRGEIRMAPRQGVAELPAAERLGSFAEVELGLTEEQAKAEAERCLSCGICSECLNCVYVCKANCIQHDMAEATRELGVGAVILATGYDRFDPTLRPEYGFGRYPNVITSLEFERILSASGPFEGHVLRPSDHQAPRRVAWIQCVGSRDTECGNGYCSSVCCMYATKQAIIAREHDAEIQPTIFYNDLRAFGKGFERYYERAKRDSGVQYVKSIASTVKEQPGTRNLIIQHATENGEVKEQEFDLVVLSVGLKPSAETQDLARSAGIALDDFGFVRSGTFTPNMTSRGGVFTCGVAENPMDIPETVMSASSAAALAAELLAPARGTLVAPQVYPPEKELNGQAPRVGVFICHCGSNIARVVDVKDVAAYAETLGNVVHSEDNLYTCATDTQRKIKEIIEAKGLNRVVISSCTPRTHEPLFQEMLREAGLNKYLFEMANIRDQCSWVHANEPDRATDKAKDLTRMAVQRAATLQPLFETSLEVVKKGLVIGGGLAGMTAALSLARQGFDTSLVEREDRLGGRLRDITATVDGEDPRALLEDLVRQVESEPRITLYTHAEVEDFTGHVGRFHTVIQSQGEPVKIDHGVVIVATGGAEYKPSEYLYGEDPQVLTQLELEAKLGVWESASATGDRRPGTGSAPSGSSPVSGLPSLPNHIVMIQCVGSRDEEHVYCSRVCCTEAVKNALRLKRLNPEAQVTVLYRDVRTYGTREVAYRKAREAGVLFVRYEPESKPVVRAENGRLEVTVTDPVLGRPLRLTPDALVLSSAVRAHPSAPDVAQKLKIPLDADGFFLEAHLKLRPLDFASDGMYLCGLAHSPKPIEETITQARGAAARAAVILSKDVLQVGGMVARVDEERCAACLTCVRVCPYDVPVIRDSAAFIETASCHGCGSCAAACPARAIQVGHYKDEQVLAKLVV